MGDGRREAGARHRSWIENSSRHRLLADELSHQHSFDEQQPQDQKKSCQRLTRFGRRTHVPYPVVGRGYSRDQKPAAPPPTAALLPRLDTSTLQIRWRSPILVGQKPDLVFVFTASAFRCSRLASLSSRLLLRSACPRLTEVENPSTHARTSSVPERATLPRVLDSWAWKDPFCRFIFADFLTSDSH
jgi:hypothetical protein